MLALSYTNPNIEERYFVHATASGDGDTQNPDEDEVILNPIIKNNPGLFFKKIHRRD